MPPRSSPPPDDPPLQAEPRATSEEELAEALRKAQTVSALARLADSVAHDYNNILTAIQGYSELILLSYGDQAPLRADIEEIVKAAGRASALNRRLLAFSRMAPMHPEPLDLAVVAREMEETLRQLLGEEEEGRVLRLELGAAPVQADRRRIEEILTSLVERARVALPEGGTVTVRTGVEEVPVPASPGGHGPAPGRYALLTVEDTGEALDPEAKSRLFEPSISLKRQEENPSLGLAMAFRIVQQSDGFLTARSAPGEGVAFTVHLPAVPAEPGE